MRRGAFHGRNRTQSPPFYFSLLMIGGTLFEPWARVGHSRRVGKYRVMAESIRTVTVPAIAVRADFVVIDEIGRMKTACEDIHPVRWTALSGRTTVIATIAARGTPAIEQIKHRSDVLLCEVTRRNRDSIAEVILKNIEVVPNGENRRALRSAGPKDRRAGKNRRYRPL